MPRTETASTTKIEALRSEYLAVLTVLNQASQRVHRSLDEAAEALLVLRDHLQAGGRAVDIADFVDPRPLRQSLSTSMTDLEHVRHQAQRTLFRLLHEEGMTLSDIGRTWGISRQLVSRLVNEPG